MSKKIDIAKYETHTNQTNTQRPGDLQGTFKNFQATNTKMDDFMKKMVFGSNSTSITYLFLLFTGRPNIKKL